MNYKPDEIILISYLYGELDEVEKVKLEQYFLKNPDERKKVLELANVREIIETLQDKEVITPPIFMGDHERIRPLWQSTSIKVIASLAASFLLLMIAGRLIGMEIRYNQGELRIGFGGTKQEAPLSTAVRPVEGTQATLSSEAVQTMINASLIRNNETIAMHWNDQQKKVDQSIRQSLALNSKKIDEGMKRAAQASQDRVSTFVSGLQHDNLRLMKDYLQLSATEQKKYVENLLGDFSKYLQEQRNQDFSLFQTRMNSIEKKSDQFKQETEQILSSIISTASITKKKNSY